MNMREKIARAIAMTPCNGVTLRDVMQAVAEPAGVAWSEETFIRDMGFLADGVLEAMREPTTAMEDAFYDTDDGMGGPSSSVTKVWHAMIDAARSPSPQA